MVSRIIPACIGLSLLVSAVSCGSTKTAAPKSEEQINSEFLAIVESANNCAAHEQCISIYPGCPLGCSAFINASEEERVKQAADRLILEWSDLGGGEYRSCAYSCLAPGQAVCVEGNCREEEPPGAGNLQGCAMHRRISGKYRETNYGEERVRQRIAFSAVFTASEFGSRSRAFR